MYIYIYIYVCVCLIVFQSALMRNRIMSHRNGSTYHTAAELKVTCKSKIDKTRSLHANEEQPESPRNRQQHHDVKLKLALTRPKTMLRRRGLIPAVRSKKGTAGVEPSAKAVQLAVRFWQIALNN